MIFNFNIEKILPCLADSTKIRVVVSIDKDLSQYFPYVKAYLKKGLYVPKHPSFSIKKDGKTFNIYRDNITLIKLVDEKEALRDLEYISNIFEEVMKHLDSITPDYTQNKPPSPLEILKYLPKTNCKICGEESCFAFAVKISNEEKNVMLCQPLFTDENKEKRGKLLNLLLESGLDVPSEFL